MARTLSPDEIRALLGELVEELAKLGQPARIHVIGGAAVALVNPARTATNDIDGYIRLVDATEVLEELKRRWGLEAEWFNWKAQGLGPPVAGEEMWHEVLRSGEVVLFAANTDALLAMKLRAARGKDTDDIAFLLRACGVTTVDQAAEIFEAYYPGDALSMVAQARVEHALTPRPDS